MFGPGIRCESYEDAINKLQNYVDREWHYYKGHKISNDNIRKWLKAIPEDSYSEDRYRVEIWVLEGSPVKLIAVINHNNKSIICLSNDMRVEKRFNWQLAHHLKGAL